MSLGNAIKFCLVVWFTLQHSSLFGFVPNSFHKYIFQGQQSGKFIGYKDGIFEGGIKGNYLNRFKFVDVGNSLYCIIHFASQKYLKMEPDGSLTLENHCQNWEKFIIENAINGFYLKSSQWNRYIGINASHQVVTSTTPSQDYVLDFYRHKKTMVVYNSYKRIQPVQTLTIEDESDSTLSGATLRFKPCESCAEIVMTTDSLGRVSIDSTNFDDRYVLKIEKPGFHSRTIVASRISNSTITLIASNQANTNYYDIKEEYDLLSNNLPFSENYQKTRKRFIDKFFYKGAIAKAHRTDDGGNRFIKFGDQTYYMGFALLNFAVEYNILNRAGLHSEASKSQHIISQIIDEINYIQANGYQPQQDGFIVRDIVPITSNSTYDASRRTGRDLQIPGHIKIEESDWENPGIQSKGTYPYRAKEPSIDQITMLLLGLWGVKEFASSSNQVSKAQSLQDKLWDYLKTEKFYLTVPNSDTIVPRGGHLAQFSAYTIAKMLGKNDNEPVRFKMDHLIAFDKTFTKPNPACFYNPVTGNHDFCIGPLNLSWNIAFDLNINTPFLFSNAGSVADGYSTRLSVNQSLKNVNAAGMLAQMACIVDFFVGTHYDAASYAYDRLISATPELSSYLGLNDAPSCVEVLTDFSGIINDKDVFWTSGTSEGFVMHLLLTNLAFNDKISHSLFNILSIEAADHKPYLEFRGHLVAEYLRAKHFNLSASSSLLTRSRDLLDTFPTNRVNNTDQIDIHAGPNSAYNLSNNPVWFEDNRWERHGQKVVFEENADKEYTGLDFLVLHNFFQYYDSSLNHENFIIRDY